MIEKQGSKCQNLQTQNYASVDWNKIRITHGEEEEESIYALAVTKHHFENITQDSHVLTVLAQLNYLLYASPDSYYTGF